MRDGDVGAAMAALERGMEIAGRIGDREAEAVGAVFQGKSAMAQGAYEEALALFRRAAEAADATGMPHLLALTRCVLGTFYSEIGGPMTERATEYHAETLALMEQPTAAYLAAWLWAEMGACALASGDHRQAGELLDTAVAEPTTVSNLMRPLALSGMASLALADGRVDDARDLLDECASYVHEHQMRDQIPALTLLRARVAAAEDGHAEAIALLDQVETVAVDGDLRPLRLQALEPASQVARCTWRRGFGHGIACGWTARDRRDRRRPPRRRATARVRRGCAAADRLVRISQTIGGSGTYSWVTVSRVSSTTR